MESQKLFREQAGIQGKAGMGKIEKYKKGAEAEAGSARGRQRGKGGVKGKGV